MTEKAQPKTATPPSPEQAASRLVGVTAGAFAGVCACTVALVAGVPAPDALGRAVVAGFVVRIAAGWAGAALAASFRARRGASASSAEPDR